ncbi:hypothetical protein ACFFX1_29425 [Dactylosporangium sucinum]|uniref:Uncharacterized protein n=1 Tax=Dactylosporangium sucinum TaxID=1424081 RepID=A0A917X2B1_9ACTN|nr:hypothetical protein [Dactylosporangium sucinum]GGM56442.1 hypothetical protein GCM10007977_067720 [Dactylosporangium sucinum]
MTQPTPEAPVPSGRASVDAVTVDEQETLRLADPNRAADPDATRPMSLADLLDND